MSNQINALAITAQYPAERFNLLVPMQTVAEISDIHKPVMNVVQISKNPNDKEIYEQEKAYTDKSGRKHPPKYAITKKGLTKLMRAAGIKILSSRPLVPSTCQKCANMNAGIGKPVRCGGCPNKDVKYEVTISAPQLTGENIEIVAQKEIIVDDVVVGMTERQKQEFLKFRNEMCESKALNRALREAMQIKGTYFLEEFDKPFVVAYLVPNLDNAAVREKAVESFFGARAELYGGNNETARKTIYVDRDSDNDESDGYEAPQIAPQHQYNALPAQYNSSPSQQPPQQQTQARPQQQPTRRADPNICSCCGKQISDGVANYSIENFGTPMCMDCQRQNGGN